MKKTAGIALAMLVSIGCSSVTVQAATRQERIQREKEAMSRDFAWWPTDAQPAPVQDVDRGGFWWWPQQKGTVGGDLWGNRGFIYVNKVIVDYQSDELPPPQSQELRPSLLIKKILRNIKIYFDFDSSSIRNDAEEILSDAVRLLKKNPETSILITGNTDVRGSESYNEKLGKRRGQAVADYMIANGIDESRIKIVSRGKLDAVAPVTDIVGMQKDRNAQFMVAQVEEVMMQYQPGAANHPDAIPADAANAVKVGEDEYMVEEEKTVEGEVRVSTREYVVKKGDTLWIIAKKEMGSGHRWKYLYQLNKDVIKNPDRLKPGTTLIIPVE